MENKSPQKSNESVLSRVLPAFLPPMAESQEKGTLEKAWLITLCFSLFLFLHIRIPSFFSLLSFLPPLLCFTSQFFQRWPLILLPCEWSSWSWCCSWWFWWFFCCWFFFLKIKRKKFANFIGFIGLILMQEWFFGRKIGFCFSVFVLSFFIFSFLWWELWVCVRISFCFCVSVYGLVSSLILSEGRKIVGFSGYYYLNYETILINLWWIINQRLINSNLGICVVHVDVLVELSWL